MPVPTVGASSALDARVRSEFESTLAVKRREMPAFLSGLWLDVQSQKSEELYHVFDSVPVPVRQARGDGISRDAFGENTATIINHRFSKSISWHTSDAADDQTGMLTTRAQDLAARFIELRERIMIQILTQAVDASLLPSQPVSYDGNQIFLGSARFGSATGNIFTGTGVATVAAVQADYWNALEVMMSFQDTEGQPYWLPEQLVGSNLVVVCGSGNSQVLRRLSGRISFFGMGPDPPAFRTFWLKAGASRSSIRLLGSRITTGLSSFRVNRRARLFIRLGRR